MRKRYSVLFLLILFRFILGWIEIQHYHPGKKLSVSGNIIERYQSDTKCILLVGRFLIEKEGICAEAVGAEIRAVGIIDRKVIDSFLGRLWLVSAEIDVTEKNPQTPIFKGYVAATIDNFREKMVGTYKRFLPDPESGLLAGIVLGYKKDIGREFYEEMINSGSVHIAVASGYNVLLVGGTALSLCFWLFKRSRATVIAIFVMVFYAVLAGADPPVIRAVWMAGLMYLAQVMGRSNISAWILALTATVMVLIEPPLIIDPSFQLSVAASLGLIVFEPWLTRRLKLFAQQGIVEVLGRLGIMTTIATMVMTAPVIWFHFGRMSLIGIVSNILILPFVPPIMILGSAMLVFPELFSLPVYVLAHFLVGVIQFFGR
jgi:ComEC/Rec2-related protein